jgi:hypothetical protein
MKKIFQLLLTLVVVLTACDDLTELNDNPKRTPVAPAGSLFASAQKALIDNLSSPNVNLNIFRLIAQQWTETTYTDESNYDLSTRNIPQNWWHAFYRDVIQDLREARKIAEEDESLDPEALTNQIAMIEIMEVYAWSVLVDTFGDIPYTEALKVEATDEDILSPVFDDAATIYSDLITRLNAALGQLNTAADSWGTNDLLYNGNVEQWIKLGNSIKLKLGITLADVNPTLSKSTVESAAPNVFESNSDNAIFLYKSAPPNTNPVWVNLVQSGRKDFVAANTLVDEMNELDDPRRDFYFTTVDTIEYNGTTPVDTLTVFYGGIYGASNNYATYSKPGDIVDNSDFPALLMDYSEVEFYLAEAVARGFNVGGTAAEHYNNAITASMEYWGVAADDIAAYLAQPEVAYGTATGTYKEKIGKQLWIALYNRGFEAWREWRRHDSPVLVAPPDAFSDVPIRFTYPVSEQNLNTNNYDDAVAAMGGDEVDIPVFWDVN